MGYNATISVLHGMYVGMIWMFLGAVFVDVRYLESDFKLHTWEAWLWACNIGYFVNEIFEMQDKGIRDYFTLAGWVNYWDLVISAVWLALLAVRILFVIDSLEPNPVISEIDTFFWAVQAFSLTFRSLVLFQTSEYFGVLIRMMQRLIVQMYVCSLHCSLVLSASCSTLSGFASCLCCF